MRSRESWRAAAADAWASVSLLVIATPSDENTDQAARAIRDHLCQPDPHSTRDSAPTRDRTFCATIRNDSVVSGSDLLETIADQSGQGTALEQARSGGPVDAFYAAISGAVLPAGWTISRWAGECLRAIWPASGSARVPGHLHLLVLLTCSFPSLGQPPLPEGAELMTAPPATEGELSQIADAAVQDLWPAASPAESMFLSSGLLDMASGRFADLDAAAGILADRLPLADVRAGATIAWSVEDPPVAQAGRDLERLGFVPGSFTWRPPSGMRQADLLGALWAAGLWLPPADDWLEGLTTRGWIALGIGETALAVERSVVEVVRRCLAVERLGRQIFHLWLGDSTMRQRLDSALWTVPATSRNKKCLAQQIADQAVLGSDEASPESLIEVATFGQLVHLLQRTGGESLRRPLTDCLWRLVEARNDAAHGHAPQLAQFVKVIEDSTVAIRGLRSTLR